MTAPWRKSSHSSHAGENCVEIALDVTRRAQREPVDPRRGYPVAQTGGTGWWYVSSRA
jgi:hypothetical protein